MPLITLTPGQFAKKRPKGNYQDYLRYVDTARAGRPHAVPKGKLVDLPMNPAQANKLLLQNLMSGYMSPAQMRKEAVRAVNESISSALGDVRSTTAAAQKQATDQARAYEGFAKALAGMRREDAGYVGELYRDAAADQARFAGGLTGAVGQAAQADAAAQARDVAAATGQGGYQGTNVPAMTNVGYFLGGVIPSGRLAENAVYAGENELRQGLASAGRLGLESSAMRQKAIDLQAELARARTKLTAGRPAAIREQLDQLSDDQRANLATLANVLYLQNTQAKTTADLLGTYQGQPTIDTYRDKQGRVRRVPSGYQVKTSKDGSQFLAPLPRAPSTARGTERNAAGLTPSQQATQDRMREQTIRGTRTDMLGVLQNKTGPLWNPVPKLAQGFREPTRKTYSQAKQYLMTNYANDLIKQYPNEEARIRQTVEEALASAGFKQVTATKPPRRAPGPFNPFQPIPIPSTRPSLPTIPFRRR